MRSRAKGRKIAKSPTFNTKAFTPILKFKSATESVAKSSMAAIDPS